MLRSSLGLQRIGHNLATEQQQKYDTNELIYKTETDSQRKQLMVTKRELRASINYELGISSYKLIFIK